MACLDIIAFCFPEGKPRDLPRIRTEGIVSRFVCHGSKLSRKEFKRSDAPGSYTDGWSDSVVAGARWARSVGFEPSPVAA